MKVLICILSLLFTACSRVDIALNWADTYLYYELKSELDFKGPQKQTLEKSTDQFVADAKMEWIPPLATRFKLLAENIESIPNEEIKIRFENEMTFLNSHFKSLFAKAGDQVPPLSKAMTEENWKQFNKNFEKKNKEIISDKPKNKLLNNIEQIAGSLTKDQEEKILKWEKENPVNHEIRIENRRHVINLLNAKMDPWTPEKWSEAIQSWAKDPESLQLPKYKDQVKSRTASMVDLLSDIVKTMSPKQKTNLKKNLLKWAENLEKGAKT